MTTNQEHAANFDWRGHISSNPEVLAGKPVLRGTRLSVEFLLRLLASGWTSEQVLESYPALTPDGLRAVFAFAAESLENEQVFPLHREVA